MQSTFQKQGSNSTITEEEAIENPGVGPMVGRILRTTQVISVSQPQRQENFALEDTPWEGNHYYHASVSRGPSQQ